MVKVSKSIAVILFVILLLCRCANQLPPGGGDVDRIPPDIIEIYPSDNTTNYDDNYFEIEFSEYVDKRSFRDALFISPNIEGRLIIDWTGTTVTVEFEEGLEPDITYTITVGTDLVDRNNRNRMLSSFSFAFSTGDRIDRRSIQGKVFDANPEGVLIYAYKLGSDTDSLLNRKPNYVSQTGKDGTFKLNGLAESYYRLFAVKDEYRDLIYSLDQDMIGVPAEDINLTGKDTVYSGIRFKLFKADTTAPRLLKGIMTDEKHILVTVTEELNSTILTNENFYLADSTNSKLLLISNSFKKYGKKDEIVLVAKEKLNINNSVFLHAKVLKDTSGNSFMNDYVELTISDKPDTTAVNVIATTPSGTSKRFNFESPQIKIFFDDAVQRKDFNQAISFKDTLNNHIEFEISFIDDASIKITPTKDLLPETDYVIQCDFNYIKDIPGNSQDSVYKFSIKTITGLDYTGVTGNVLNYDSTANPILVLENLDKQEYKYQLRVTGENFSFEEIEAGKYNLWCYYDSDSSGHFNYGWPQPIKYSEEFIVYPDTLKLKPRWIVTDVEFDVKM